MAPTFNAIGTAVADMAATLDFYRRLGLDFPAGAETQPHVETELPGGIRLMFDTFDTIRSFDPDFTPPTGDGMSLAFLCSGPDEVDRVYADLVAAGHPGAKAPWDADWGQRYAVVEDPDGNGVDLFAPLNPAG
ncbi:VOC family protein [Jidongwangia harbinensis]|uniref:VOC family protein n=1 Tax=Jidongwangia harbinensis TaxID=2878561 RepID=UPI001CD9704D|nr:VOC family protein [Jidongwangia harbinensis]MCA2215402.1 VOC family protein [Jidongwangia harbinensis]